MSIVVPVRHVSDSLRACLASIGRLDPPCPDVVVVVDGGGDDVAALARAAGARVVHLPDNRGPAAARNAGVRAASGDLLFFVDSDVALPADTIGRVLAAFEADPALDALIGSYDDHPGEPNFLSQYKNLAHHYVHQTSRADTFSFWSACGAIRRSSFERVGGFDERFRRPSIEDIELGSRLQAAGCRVRLDKSIQVTHLKRWTFLRLMQTEVRDRAIPWTRLILRDRRMPNDLNLRWRGRAAVACASLLACALAVTPWWPWALTAALGLAAVLVMIDRPLFAFFRARRGGVFAVRALAAHWAHYLCCSAGLVAGTAAHVAGDRGRSDVPVPLEKKAGRA